MAAGGQSLGGCQSAQGSGTAGHLSGAVGLCPATADDRTSVRHRLADLFLDTLPYNAHTTASDALWTGLPLLTRMGETFASRVAASLLRAVGMPELITETEAEYEQLAVQLAHDPERRRALCRRLQQNRPTAPLFDCRTFTRHLEAAYAAIYERHHAGLPPDHIHIAHVHIARGTS